MESCLTLQDLASAGQTKRPTSCLLILPKPAKASDAEADEDLKGLFEEVHAKVKKLETI
jgi:hypothetical protein